MQVTLLRCSKSGPQSHIVLCDLKTEAEWPQFLTALDKTEILIASSWLELPAFHFYIRAQ
jgi:hypothetical protein